MKKSGSVYVFTLALIFIGSVCTELKPEEYLSKYGYLAVKPGRDRAEKPIPEEMVKAILKFQSFNELLQTGVIDETTANKMLATRYGVKDINAYKTETKLLQTLLKRGRSKYSGKSRYSSRQKRRAMSRAFKRSADLSPLVEKARDRQRLTIDISFANEGGTSEQTFGFCNYTYNSIDAAMRVYGKDFVFVDKWAVIDGRYGHRRHVLNLFTRGPKWVQAAAYSKKYMEAILFMDDKIWVYKLYSVYGQFIHLGIFPNSNKHSHSPECAMVYNDEIYFLKNGTFFRFEPHVKNLVKQGSEKLGVFSISITVDAAISSDSDIIFIVKDKIFKLTNEIGVEVMRANRTNRVFNKCP